MSTATPAGTGHPSAVTGADRRDDSFTIRAYHRLLLSLPAVTSADVRSRAKPLTLCNNHEMPINTHSHIKVRGHVLHDDPSEDMTWNQKRFPKRKLFQHLAMLDVHTAKLPKTGFLHTRGNYGWLLIGPVQHDGDRYSRPCSRRRQIFGAASALRELGMPEAHILNESEVIDLAMRQVLYLRLRNHASGKILDVAMLHPWMSPETPRSCGIYIDETGAFAALNPETPAPHNTPEVRYSILSKLADGQLAATLQQRLLPS